MSKATTTLASRTTCGRIVEETATQLFGGCTILETWGSWKAGMMGALAPDVETARKLLLEQCSFIPKSDLEQEPQVITEMSAFHCWGGG